ncbi:MAG: PQQ-binding-like beta-propeller repeat protein [Flavobacteriaceae bacterium]
MTVQLIHDRDFAHLNFIAKEVSGQKPSQGLIDEVFNIELERPLLGTPTFFTDHTTSGKNIVAQDISNVLYFISANGKVLWKKQLDGPILGNVNEVDLLRNGKKQLAFATEKNLYVLDRNGKTVPPFPKKFKDAITQPLAVFDYDNNRKYRFVICQGENVFMYDSKGDAVNGFSFKKASSPIAMTPQHIRMGTKDYIVIAEENGQLNILSRTGKERIKVSKTFSFSSIPVEKEGSQFVVISKDNVKTTITQEGKISAENLQVSQHYWFTILGNTKVTLDDHLLRINGQLAELPLGMYSKPNVFLVNKKTYVAVTELNEHKVYLFDGAAKLQPNFPIYGTSEIDLADANKNKKLNLLVQGQPKEVILYQVN